MLTEPVNHLPPAGGPAPRRLLRQAGAFAAASLMGPAVLWAFYGFRHASIPGANAGAVSVADYIRENGWPEMIESFSARLAVAANRARGHPESYVLGMADVIAWGSRNSYLFGTSYPTGKWWYFPVALAVKASIALLALLAYHAATPARVAPNYLAFANDLWGGVEGTHRIFNDSNVEYGQGVKQAAEYLAREGITDCWFAALNHRELLRAVQPCRVLPSALRIVVSPTVIEPVALIAGSILVYRGRFAVPLAAAMSHAYRSGQFLRAGGVAEGVAEGRTAVEMGGDDPRTHLALGLAMARAGQREEARRELETASELAARASVFRNAEVRARQEPERLR